MSDLRKAAEMALEALDSYPLPFQVPAREALRQALAQSVDAVSISQKCVDETAKGKQEPVAWLIQYKTRHDIVWGSAPGLRNNDQILGMEPLYTAPPKREWVGLTDADKQEAFDETQEASGGFWEFADYLEAKLKDKNGYPTCPPCTHDCNEGRDCPARKHNG